jgi:hypothetical protein
MSSWPDVQPPGVRQAGCPAGRVSGAPDRKPPSGSVR